MVGDPKAVEKKGHRIIRRLLTKAEHKAVREQFYPVFKNGSLRNPEASVCWDKYHPGIRRDSPNCYEQAGAGIVVSWCGRERKAAIVSDGAILSIPGVGPVAAAEVADFHLGIPPAKRRLTGRAIGVIIPSRGIRFFGANEDFKVIRDLEQSKALGRLTTPK